MSTPVDWEALTAGLEGFTDPPPFGDSTPGPPVQPTKDRYTFLRRQPSTASKTLGRDWDVYVWSVNGSSYTHAEFVADFWSPRYS